LPERLAGELAFAAHRLQVLETRPRPVRRGAADQGDVEERAWLAFLIAYLSPLDDDDDPFASVSALRTTWPRRSCPPWTMSGPDPGRP